jgi:hypothetical protein
LAGVFLAEPLDGHCKVAGLTGVVESSSEIHVAAARSEDEHVGCPAPAVRLGQEPLRVVRANRSLESVKNDEAKGR